jgi:hypothetical protein
MCAKITSPDKMVSETIKTVQNFGLEGQGRDHKQRISAGP